MEVPILLLAEYANNTPDGKLNLMGVFTSIKAKELPVRLPQVFVISQIRATPIEQDKPVTTEAVMMDTDGKRVFSIEGQGTIPKARSATSTELTQIVGIAGLRIEAAGRYDLVFSVNGREEARRPIDVVLSPDAPKEGTAS